jgi:hypothetical protein
MSLHLLVGVGALLILVAVSAYRGALRDEPVPRYRMNPGKRPPFDGQQ